MHEITQIIYSMAGERCLLCGCDVREVSDGEYTCRICPQKCFVKDDCVLVSNSLYIFEMDDDTSPIAAILTLEGFRQEVPVTFD